MNKSKIFKRAGLFVAASLLSLSQAVQAEINISGWVNEGIILYDDGQDEEAVQSTDNGTTLATRITFAGSTDTSFGKAGFEIIVEPRAVSTPLIFANQDNTHTTTPVDPYRASTGHTIGVLGNSVYLSGAGGKLTVGLQSMPTDNIAVLEDPSLTLWSTISPVFRGNGFTIRGAAAADGAAPVWGTFLNCFAAPALRSFGGIGIDCNGIYRQGVRYDLPAFGPVSAAIGWANESVYDVSAKYKGQMGRISTQVALGYATNSDPGGGYFDGADNFQLQLGLMDPITGLFGTFAFQKEDADLVNAAVATGLSPTLQTRENGTACTTLSTDAEIMTGTTADHCLATTNAGTVSDDTTAWWFKVGIKKEWSSIGPTAISFNYGLYEDQYGLTEAKNGVTGSEVDRLGFSVDQYFGSNLIVYFSWQRRELDVDQRAQPGATGGADGNRNFTDEHTPANYGNAEDLDFYVLGFTYFF